MKNTLRKITSLTLALAIALTCVFTLAGCNGDADGGKEDKKANKPEAVAEEFVRAIIDGDADKAFSYLPEDLVDFTVEEYCDGDEAEFAEMFEYAVESKREDLEYAGFDLEKAKVKVDAVYDATEYDLEDINAELEDAGLELKDAKEVEIEITCKVDGEEMVDEIEIIVIEIDGKWGVYDF